MTLGRSRWLAGASPIFFIKAIHVLGQQGWYYQQLFRLADGREPDERLGVLGGLFRYLWSEWTTAWRLRRARR